MKLLSIYNGLYCEAMLHLNLGITLINNLLYVLQKPTIKMLKLKPF